MDSQRTKVHERPTSQVLHAASPGTISTSSQQGNYYVLEYRPGSGNGAESWRPSRRACWNWSFPILPHRLNDDWQRVIAQMDFLDVPGMRAGRRGPRRANAPSADTLEEQMEIVKRGKVSYLFERYTDELQIQTLLLLAARRQPGSAGLDEGQRGQVGPRPLRREGLAASRSATPLPALFVGMTGMDEEFRNREEGIINTVLYDTRLGTLLDVLGS